MADQPDNPTPKKKWVEPFLAALSEYGNVSKAAKKAKVHRSVVYDERVSDEAFKQRWDAALAIGTEALEDEARRRAFEGTLKPVFYLGKKVGSIREYSDTLTIFLLKAHKPDLYRETSRVLNINVTPDELANMSDDDLDELERKLTNAS